MNQVLAIIRKELNSYFSSPMALIFVGVFLAVTQFTFFWVEAFFARGLADVRPMFSWMPILLIFLVGALTMRQWSEEQQTGTLEVLLTLPARTYQLVLAKFLSVMALVAVTLGLTFFLPLTVSLLGNLDWGPVIGGYLAALLLAAAYAAIGLFISSRTDNQIVALILTVLVGGLFYLVGSRAVVDFVSDNTAEILRGIGAGSRFESIERGVVDIRDLVYYLSLAGLFLMLNVISLDSKRWSLGENTLVYRQNMIYTAALVAINLILLNVWLFPLNGLRLDLTENQEYSLSGTTRDLLDNLQEPLLVRAYFSERTHPLLAPLVPQVRDKLAEYQIAADGMMQVEVIDPLENPELEAEANQTYGIQPTPLQAADRYGASVVNAYFNILVRYGDQNVVLNFQDLIEIQPNRGGQVEVTLRNLEYDLTSAIKKVVFGFQSIDAVLASIQEPVSLTLFYTPNTLGGDLTEVPATIETVANDIAARSNGSFTYNAIDLDAPGSPVNRQAMIEQYGIQAIPTALFSSESFYLHMVLQIGNESQLLYPSGGLTEADIRTAIESSLKRAADGFLKVVGLWTPPNAPQMNQFGQQQPSIKQYNTVAEQLRQDYTVNNVDLSTGQVPLNVDVLFVIAPQNMSDLERYAIDQYLMRGGSVIVAAGNYVLNPGQFGGGLDTVVVEDGLQAMLASYGIHVNESLVLDPQNEPFPSQVPRDVGGMQVIEIQAVDYPFFVDVRPDGMNEESPILGSLPAVTMNWSSPITVDESLNATRTVDILLESTSASWTQTDTTIQPDYQLYPEYGFAVGAEQQSHVLAVSVQGSFDSYFAGQEIPQPEADPTTGEIPPTEVSNIGTIETSPESSRLVVLGSAEFLNDLVFELSANLSRNYLNSLQLAQNTVDWSVEDLELLEIRARGSAARVLSASAEESRTFWEGINYVFAIAAVVGIGFVWNARQRSEEPMELLPRKES